MPTREQRIEGGIVGLLVGDALGVPYEFHAAKSIPPAEELEYEPPSGFVRSYHGVPPGTWSDDGAQALCLLESLLEVGAFDARDFGRRMVAWLEHGHLAVDGRVFDVGNQTKRALVAIASGGRALALDAADASSNGNGALMRVLPLALFHRGSDAELVRDARLSSEITHPHLRSQLCCAIYCLCARRMLEGVSDPWFLAVSMIERLFVDDVEVRTELERFIRPFDQADHPGSGYVVDTLRSARSLLELGSYERVVKGAIALGTDTDTTAAVAGGLAGLRDGFTAIPERFRVGLRGRELYQPLVSRLLAR